MNSRRAFFACRALLLLVLAMTSIALASQAAFASQGVFRNIDEIARSVNFTAWTQSAPSRTVKIAVFDNGFREHAAEIGKTLPAATTYHAGPVAVDADHEESHGLFMAQLISALLAKTPRVSYELHLYSSFGYSNLKAAVDDAIKRGIDVVLYAQVWEYGGNGDGRGFINQLVSRATQAGILWVNAAGNFANMTAMQMIERAADDWARLPGPNSSVRVRCEENSSGKCSLRAVLSWNDFKDDVNAGTDKDLDLVLSDDTLKIIATGGLTQKKSFPEGEPGSSLYPREIVEADVKPGLYYLRVKIRSSNFQNTDQLRINVSGDGVRLLDATPGETLLPPADNPSVITVGASDSEKSSEGRALKKPELRATSLVVLQNGDQYKGSSNAAAIAATAVAVLKSAKPELSREKAISLLTGGGPVPAGQGLALDLLQFRPLRPGCFALAILPRIPEPAMPLLRAGAVTVATSAGLKIFTAEDPFTLIDGVERTGPDDMLIVHDDGFEVFPRSMQSAFAPGGIVGYEVVQQPEGQYVCSISGGGPGSPGATPGGLIRLPSPQGL